MIMIIYYHNVVVYNTAIMYNKSSEGLVCPHFPLYVTVWINLIIASSLTDNPSFILRVEDCIVPNEWEFSLEQSYETQY